MLGHGGITGGETTLAFHLPSLLKHQSQTKPQSDCQNSEAQKELLTFVIITNKALPNQPRCSAWRTHGDPSTGTDSSMQGQLSPSKANTAPGYLFCSPRARSRVAVPFRPAFGVTPTPPAVTGAPTAPSPTSRLSGEVLLRGCQEKLSYSSNENLASIVLCALPAPSWGYIHVVLIPTARCHQPGHTRHRN